MTTLRGHSVVRFGNLLALAALFALLAPTAGLLANSQFAGWEVGHGHIGSPQAVASHTHAYEDPSSEPAADQAASDVTFTPSDDAGVGAALVLTREPAPLPAQGAPILETFGVTSLPLDGGADRVPTPPPQV
jgi:hypothetical protein